MKKSKYVFAIMAAVYLGVAIAGSVGWLIITENILLGLSLSALLSAVSDIFYNIGYRYIINNDFNYVIQTTLAFLEDKQSKGIPAANPNISIAGVNRYIESIGEDFEKATHPNIYRKKRFVKVLYRFSQICFIVSIGVFIVLPFLPILPQKFASSFLTLAAFAAMSYNLHISEVISDIISLKDDFMNKEQLIIQTAYSDFTYHLNTQLYYQKSDVIASTQESDLNAHT